MDLLELAGRAERPSRAIARRSAFVLAVKNVALPCLLFERS